MERWLRNNGTFTVLFITVMTLVLTVARECDDRSETEYYRQGFNRGFSGLEIGEEPKPNRIARRGWRRGWADGNAAYVNQRRER